MAHAAADEVIVRDGIIGAINDKKRPEKHSLENRVKADVEGLLLDVQSMLY